MDPGSQEIQWAGVTSRDGDATDPNGPDAIAHLQPCPPFPSVPA